MARHLSFSLVHTIASIILLIFGALATAADAPLAVSAIIRVGYVPVLSQLPMVESFDNDHLRWQHVDIDLQPFQSFTALDAAFRVDAVDIAYLPQPNVVRMKADGKSLSILGSLHSGGATLAITRQSWKSGPRAMIIGLPSVMSSEHLVLLQYLKGRGLQQGIDFKVLGIQLDKAVHHLRAGNIDGFFLPAPYPSMVQSTMNTDDLVAEPINQVLHERHSTVLAVNNRLLAPRYKTAVNEYLYSLHRSCKRLETDISAYAGAQTAILQERYFGFSPQQVLTSFASVHNWISFGYKAITEQEIHSVIDMMLNHKLLLNSVEAEELLAAQHRFSSIPSM